LEVAKKLLTNDGCLIVAIDENEQAELAVLLKEVFKGYEIHCITVVHNPRGIQGTNFSYTHEYAFFVMPAGKKSIGNRKISKEEIEYSNLRNWGSESERKDAKNCFYPVIIENDEIVGFGDVCKDREHPKQTVKKGNKYLVYPIDINGVERKWRYARQSVEEVQTFLKTKKTKTGYEVEIGKDFEAYRTVWIDSRYDANEYGTKIVKSLVPGCKFDFPKSLYNVYDAIYAVVGNDKDAIVLDFFGGSGTTAHAVLMLNKEEKDDLSRKLKDGEITKAEYAEQADKVGNRKFIICEQMDYVEDVTRERIRKVTENDKNGSFIYAELAQANQLFVSKIQDAKNTKGLLSIWEEMKKTAFLSYKVKPQDIDATKKDFESLSFEDQQRFLISTLDKNLLYVPYSEIEDKTYAVSKEDIALNAKFYGRN
jgi:adenine-specific DNA-methyltransferase